MESQQSAFRDEIVAPDSVRVLPTDHLEGTIAIPGDKVAAVHLSLATAVLTQESVIKNNHYCGDVLQIYDWLTSTGLVTISRTQDEVRITPNRVAEVVDLSNLSSTRSNVCLVTPLALRDATVLFKGTAGCGFTTRKVDKHFELMDAFGLSISERGDLLEMTCAEPSKSVNFDCSATERNIPSVGVTCHALMASLAYKNKMTLTNVALEPAPMALIEYVRRSTNREIVLEGRTLTLGGVGEIEHRSAEVTLPPDVTVAGTYIAAVTAAGNGELHLEGLPLTAIPDSMLETYEHMGIHIARIGATAVSAVVRQGDLAVPPDVSCGVWPGFPSDVAPMFAASVAGIGGRSEITDNIYDKRSSHIEGLNDMGYELATEGNKTVIQGHTPKRIGNVAVEALDIRSGAALIVGALGSSAESVTVTNYHQVYRGYANLAAGLQTLGAKIEAV